MSQQKTPSKQAAKKRVRLFVINDQTMLRICPELASEIGLNESIALLQLEFLIGISTTEEIDGNLWTYQNLKDLHVSTFPFWSPSKIWRVMQSLKRQDLIDIGNFNKVKFDRTCWYCLKPDGISRLKSVRLDMTIFQNEKSHRSKRKMEVANLQNGNHQNEISDFPESQNPFSGDETTIPETSTETSSKTSTETSSSSQQPSNSQQVDNFDFEEEEATLEVSLSPLVVARLREIGLFEDRLPEVQSLASSAAIDDAEILRMIGAAKKKEPENGKTAALFLYRLRNLPTAAGTANPDDIERMERQRRYGGQA